MGTDSHSPTLKEDDMTLTHDMGNNETLTTGIIKQNDGTFLALLLSTSKEFKTSSGAVKWMAKRGRNADGSLLS